MKFISRCAFVSALAVAAGVVAAKADTAPQSQLASDLQYTPVAVNEPAVPPAADQIGASQNDAVQNGAAQNASDQNGAGSVAVLDDGYQSPWLVGSVEASFMQRERPGDTVIFYNTTVGTLLNASQFDFGYRSGLDTSLSCNLTSDWGVDLRYDWVGDFNSTASFVATGPPLLNPNPFGNNYNTTPPSFILTPYGTSYAATWDYRSHFETGEINLRRHFQWFDGLIGFRYGDLNEQLTGVLTQPGAIDTTTWNTHNSLAGLQIGADALLWQNPSERFRINGYAKAGIYDNDEATHFIYNNTTAPFINPTTYANASVSRPAFLGDTGLNAVYQLTPHLAWRSGYELLWVDGVALASRQVPATGTFSYVYHQTTSHVDSAGSVSYQGFKTGLELTW